jgi:hypothetical protein
MGPRVNPPALRARPGCKKIVKKSPTFRWGLLSVCQSALEVKPLVLCLGNGGQRLSGRVPQGIFDPPPVPLVFEVGFRHRGNDDQVIVSLLLYWAHSSEAGALAQDVNLKEVFPFLQAASGQGADRLDQGNLVGVAPALYLTALGGEDDQRLANLGVLDVRQARGGVQPLDFDLIDANVVAFGNDVVDFGLGQYQFHSNYFSVSRGKNISSQTWGGVPVITNSR